MKGLSKEYIEILCDVAIKFNTYKTYKTREGAIKALAKKTKEFHVSEHSVYLDIATLIYNKAKELISSRNYEDRSKNTTGFSAFEDILYDKCVVEIKKVADKTDELLISRILNWTIYWYYLR